MWLGAPVALLALAAGGVQGRKDYGELQFYKRANCRKAMGEPIKIQEEHKKCQTTDKGGRVKEFADMRDSLQGVEVKKVIGEQDCRVDFFMNGSCEYAPRDEARAEAEAAAERQRQEERGRTLGVPGATPLTSQLAWAVYPWTPAEECVAYRASRHGALPRSWKLTCKGDEDYHDVKTPEGAKVDGQGRSHEDREKEEKREKSGKGPKSSNFKLNVEGPQEDSSGK